MNIGEIAKKYASAKINCCDEQQCKLRMDKRKEFVMLKGELLVNKQSAKICDCIVFRNDGMIAHVELKNRSLDVDKIIEKFRNGGEQSYKMAKAMNLKSNFSPFFILLAQVYKDYSTLDRIKRARVKIQGRKHKILHAKCEDRLEDIIK